MQQNDAGDRTMALPAPLTTTAPDINANVRRQQGLYTILGSLTTAFAPGPSCNQVNGIQAAQPALYWGATCKNISINGQDSTRITMEPANSCYPDGLVSFLTDHDMFSTLAFFSPGLACPSGWTATGLVTYGMTNSYTADMGDEAATSALKSGETLVRCCPTGYRWQDTNAQDLCISALPSMAAITTSGFDDNCGNKKTTLTFSQGAYFANVQAYPLHLIVPANATFKPPLPTPEAHKTGHVVKIAVGIAVPLVVIFLAIVIFFGIRAYKRQRFRQQNAQDPFPANHSVRHEYSGKPELQGDIGGSINRADGHAFVKPELDHHGTQVYPRPELEAVQKPMELDSGQTRFPTELPPHTRRDSWHSGVQVNSP
ncbi:hypothetical protein NM208_g1193 [Fusarium decemcellulare]|uniref:Uncharacterized protein n=1 Tax=Fusarium decemcellulare TaxID=57161 RepID=A0ACC1SX56_9HYPO|nr:hypothetical protein NM208_g1193 [Fusarium decemcellulare]